MTKYMDPTKKFTLSYEHLDGGFGYYIRANSREEAELLFNEKCQEENLNRDDYHLTRIQKGGTNGEWLWDLWRDGLRVAIPDLSLIP